MDSENELKYKMHYYMRENYYQTVQNTALEGLKKYPGDALFKMYSGFSLVLSGRHQEAIRELESLQNQHDVNVGCLLALITAHKSCQTVDVETVNQLDAKLKQERRNSKDLGLYYGALFLYFQGKFEKASDYLDRFLKTNLNSAEGLCLKGWLDIKTDKDGSYKTSVQCFNKVLDKDKKNMDVSLGLIKIKELKQDFDSALALLNQLIVKYPNIQPPLIEKMKIQLATHDWDQTLDSCNRILAMDKCLDVLIIKTVVLICKDGNIDEAALSLRRLYGEMERMEPKNGNLFLESAQLFSYLSLRNIKLLSETIRFAEKAAQLDPANILYIIELGYQNMLQGKSKEALKFFRTATKLDESSILALIGLTKCQIEDGSVNEQIRQQVEFLQEILNNQPTAELFLMAAKLSVAPDIALFNLNQAVEIHFEKFKKYPFGVKYLYHLNPDFLMDAVKEYLKYAPHDPSSPKITEDAFEVGIMKILEELTLSCPGLVEPHHELALVQYHRGNIQEAKNILTHILDDLDATSADAHILMAKIHLQQKNYHQAAQSLEVGLSYNFKVREHPLFHLITALVQKQNGHLSDCVTGLKAAVAAAKRTAEQTEFALSLADKVTLYVELVQAYQANGQDNEAAELVEEAMKIFHGTSEEGRVVVASAELAVQRGNTNEAVELLQKIKKGQNHYVLSRTALANIYLLHKKDKEAYAECYKELCEHAPNTDTFVLLGDAYIAIQELDKAIEAYEEALKSNPSSGELIRKMGKALVKTHNFSRAINYYKESVKSGGNVDLVHDMAELYFKLGQLDNAEHALITALDTTKVDLTDLTQLCAKTKLLQLLAKVRDKSGNLTESLSALKAAKENHMRVEKRIISQSEEHKDIISTISSDMAVIMTRLRDFNGAIKCYKEALVVKPGDPKVLVALARIYMQVNDLEECQVTSQRLLAADPNSESAAVMLADLAFRKVDFETAAHHFKQLLSKRPTYWTALARLIEVSRRTGTLEETTVFLDQAQAHVQQPAQEAGFAFCKGLHEWYLGQTTSALHHFNRARRDVEWREDAVYNMIEICLNPDNDTLGGEAFSADTDDEETQDSKEMALKTAQRLLHEIAPRHSSDETLKYRLLENFWLLATRQKSNIEKALQELTSMAGQEVYREHVGVALGIATAYMLQKQVQKARNQLKRVVKNVWNYEDAEYLERSWLLLADIYIQSGKLDLPVDIIQRILDHNKSCYRAYEYAGYIAEKEQLYKDAAVHYEKAWRYGGESDPAIGYKLAFNYLKGKRYADAIDVCHLVLKLYPDYPRIHKDVLDKARSNLRT